MYKDSSNKKEVNTDSLGTFCSHLFNMVKEITQILGGKMCMCIYLLLIFFSGDKHVNFTDICKGMKPSKLSWNYVMKGIKKSLLSRSAYQIKYIIHSQYLNLNHQPFCLELIDGFSLVLLFCYELEILNLLIDFVMMAIG